MSILLTQEGDRQMFRKVYPFSPALVQTLIAVSSVLQRERTALKVMMQLLVDHRETLRVGDVVPVGDLFDVVAHGDEAFTQDMAIHFDNAKRLYHQKLLPMLERQHGLRREDVEQLAYDDPKRVAFRNDDRLVKTLLLSALVPEVESLRGLNAEKLAALNHGTIKSPVPGREGQLVLQRCRTWAAAVGEIRIGEESNPTITVQLSGVDTESIIEQARREDNQGNRIRRVRQMIFEQLGIQGEGEFEQFLEFWWRNTKRSCTVLFRNIRELPDSSLENTDESWKLVIDFPFDEAGHGPRDDLSTVQRFMQSHPDGTKTLCWVPSFFSLDAQKDLGMLVILEHILTGERFAQYSNHLSPQDRQARQVAAGEPAERALHAGQEPPGRRLRAGGPFAGFARHDARPRPERALRLAVPGLRAAAAGRRRPGRGHAALAESGSGARVSGGAASSRRKQNRGHSRKSTSWCSRRPRHPMGGWQSTRRCARSCGRSRIL